MNNAKLTFQILFIAIAASATFQLGVSHSGAAITFAQERWEKVDLSPLASISVMGAAYNSLEYIFDTAEDIESNIDNLSTASVLSAFSNSAAVYKSAWENLKTLLDFEIPEIPKPIAQNIEYRTRLLTPERNDGGQVSKSETPLESGSNPTLNGAGNTNVQLAQVSQPIQQITQVIQPVDIGALREQILREVDLKISNVKPIVYQSITRQSDADSNRRSIITTNILESGSFTNPTITGATITGSTFSGSSATITDLTVTTCTGCGTPFAWTTTSYGVSTTTTIGLLNGFLSTASSTLTNFTYSTATGTSATTTNFFSTTASSTNLFSSALSVNGYSFTVSGAPTLNDWFDQSVKTTATPSFGLTTFTDGLLVTGGTSADGGMFKTAAAGLIVRGTTGSSYDFSLQTAGGASVARVPTGTARLELAEDLVFEGNKVIRRNTSDGADSGTVGMAGGGVESATRGAWTRFSGNEAAGTGGFAEIFIGNVAGSQLSVLRADGTEAFEMLGSNGQATFTSSVGPGLQFNNTADKDIAIFNTTSANGPRIQLQSSGTSVVQIGSQLALTAAGSATDAMIRVSGKLFLMNNNTGCAIEFHSSPTDSFSPTVDNCLLAGTTTFRYSQMHATNFYGAYNAGPDVAERYPASELVEPGDVVMLDPNPPSDKTISDQTNTQITNTPGGAEAPTGNDVPVAIKKANGSSTTLGVISTAPGVTMNDPSDHSNPPVALVGRVPVKVTEENGTIAVGDRLTVSATQPGYAMKMTLSGQSIGIALESSNGQDKILVFVNLGYQQINIAQTSSGQITVAEGDFDLNGFNLLNVKAITSISGKWSIDENGNLAVQDVTVDRGINMKDQVTGQYYCVTIKNGEFDKQVGKCGTQAANNSSSTSTDSSSASQNDSEGEIAGETTTSEPATSPDVVVEPAAEPVPEPTPEPEPEPAPETVSPQEEAAP